MGGGADGFQVELNDRIEGRRSAQYRFVIKHDGTITTCNGRIPLKSCLDEKSIRCNNDGARVSTEGCASPEWNQRFRSISFKNYPAVVDIEVWRSFKGFRVAGDNNIRRSAELLAREHYEVTYYISQVNGPGCGTDCVGGSRELTLSPRN